MKELRGGQQGQQERQPAVVVHGEKPKDSNYVAVEMGTQSMRMMEHVSKVTPPLVLHESAPPQHLQLGG